MADGEEADAFITDTGLPIGNKLHNSWMIVTYGNGFKRGYGIDRVEAKEGKTWIHTRDDHALRIKDDITEEVYYQQRKLDGVNTFRIYETAVFIAEE